jgi:hypothetical protein
VSGVSRALAGASTTVRHRGRSISGGVAMEVVGQGYSDAIVVEAGSCGGDAPVETTNGGAGLGGWLMRRPGGHDEWRHWARR